ncbi:MAG: hypothetical protein ACLRPV_15470 [Lacrimispora saccharolytica]
MKRKRWIAAGIISTCLFGVSGTYAYYQDTVSVRNHISTGDINIGIQEYEVKDGKESLYADPDGRLVLPSQKISKIPRITNYAQPCYVRVKIACTGEMLVLSEQDISGMSEEWIRAGEYYYLTDPLDTGESADVFQTVTIPEEWTETSSDQRLVSPYRRRQSSRTISLRIFSRNIPGVTRKRNSVFMSRTAR